MKALRALRSGLLTFDEVVKRSGVSRFTLYRWCRVAGIDPRALRETAADAAWRKVTRPRKPTKADLRAKAGRATREWDDEQADP